jgi:hypothetical protein
MRGGELPEGVRLAGQTAVPPNPVADRRVTSDSFHRRNLSAASVVEVAPRNGAVADDLLALAFAVIARRIYAGYARSFPDPPGQRSVRSAGCDLGEKSALCRGPGPPARLRKFVRLDRAPVICFFLSLTCRTRAT